MTTYSSDGLWDDNCEYVPTQAEAREWVVERLAWQQYDWDTIAECFHPEGLVMSQEACDVVAEALNSRHTVTVTWQDGTSITYPPENPE